MRVGATGLSSWENVASMALNHHLRDLSLSMPDKTCLMRIRESIDRVFDYTRDGEPAFHASSLVQDAVAHNIEAIADAARHLTQRTKSLHPEIPWAEIQSVRRQMLDHEMRLDVAFTWQVVESGLPDLMACVQTMVHELAAPPLSNEP
jgi:uncharacterized protein with HEPN domain